MMEILRAISFVASAGAVSAFLFLAVIRPFFSPSGWTKKENEGVAVRFKVFLPLYLQKPEKWYLMPDAARYENMMVYFSTGLQWRKYNRWRKRVRKQRQKAEQEERQRKFVEAIFKEHEPEFTTEKGEDCFIVNGGVGNPIIAVPPKPNEPPTIYKPTKSADLREEIKKYAERDDDVVRIDGAKLVPQPAELCGDCPCATGNYPDVVICGIDHHAHLRSERCKYRKQAVLKPTKTVREGECKKCRYFKKHDKPPFGYCVRNDEITDEAYVKLCFEPIPPIAHKRPEPLGTVTTR